MDLFGFILVFMIVFVIYEVGLRIDFFLVGMGEWLF